MRGTNESALSKEAIYHFAAEAKAWVSANQWRLVRYELINKNLPEQMKVFTIASIPHNSRAFKSIIDLDLSMRLIYHGQVLSVNENSENTDLVVAIDQIGNSLMRLIHAFAEAPDDAKIF